MQPRVLDGSGKLVFPKWSSGLGSVTSAWVKRTLRLMLRWAGEHATCCRVNLVPQVLLVAVAFSQNGLVGRGPVNFGVGEQDFQVDDWLAGEQASCCGVNLVPQGFCGAFPKWSGGAGTRYFGVGEQDFQVDDWLAGEQASCCGVNLGAAEVVGRRLFPNRGLVRGGLITSGWGNRISRLMIGWPGSRLLAVG